MKVTIIGGSGFIGTRIVDHFTQFKGYDFRIVDIRDSHFFNDITTIGDVRNQQQMDSALAGTDLVILLAAQHRDNVTPTSLYYDTNVGGMRTTLRAMERNGVKRILFFSSVAVYGINKDNPDETSPKDPFNHYGKSKWQAEQLLQEWHTMHADWNINVVRPTVLQNPSPATRIPYALGLPGADCLDALAWLLRRKFAISAVRVKKFCATTEYDATRMQQTGFKPPYTLADGLARTLEFEFIHPRGDKITYETE